MTTKKKRRPDVARADDDDAGGVRLHKLLSQAGICSRRRGEALMQAGRVSVNGRVVRELGTRVDPQRDRVEVDGNVVAVEAPLVLVLNKPDGVVCSAEGTVDDRGRPTVLSCLKGIKTRVYPVGRLDFHTRGVLLLTNDGELAARLTHPRYKVTKTYHVKFQGQVDEEVLARLHAGVELEDGTLTRELAEVDLIKQTKTNTWVQMTLSQGLNRQLRRMGDAVGHPVLKIIRVSFAGITGDGLADGEFRRLEDKEIRAVRVLAGLETSPAKSSGGRAESRVAEQAAVGSRRNVSRVRAGGKQTSRRDDFEASGKEASRGPRKATSSQRAPTRTPSEPRKATSSQRAPTRTPSEPRKATSSQRAPARTPSEPRKATSSQRAPTRGHAKRSTKRGRAAR